MDTTPAWYHNAMEASAKVRAAGTLFVLGCQKSGTTWLQVLLRAHRAIASGGEGHFSSVLAPAMQHALKAHNDQFKTAVKFRDAELLSVTRFAIEQLFATYLENGEDPRLPGTVRWLADKTPEAAVAIPLLETLFPGSRYIHIIRDGRDCVVSGWAHLTRQNETAAFPTIAHYAEYMVKQHWVPYISRAQEAGRSLSGRYLEVRYEDLHAEPHANTRRILEFLGVDASDEAVNTCVERASFKTLANGR